MMMIALTDANKYKLLSGKLPKLLKVIGCDKEREGRTVDGGGRNFLMKILVVTVLKPRALASVFHHHHCTLCSRFFPSGNEKIFDNRKRAGGLMKKLFYCFPPTRHFSRSFFLSFFHVNKLYEKLKAIFSLFSLVS
jgi:hypothetical protein